MEQIVHASDISNPVKKIGVYSQWVDKVLEEFWNQVVAKIILQKNALNILSISDINFRAIGKRNLALLSLNYVTERPQIPLRRRLGLSSS